MWSWYYCGLYFIIRKLNHEETNNLSKVIQLVKIVSLNFIFWPSVTLHILSTWLYLLPWPSSFLPFGITSFCLPQDLPIAMTILTWDFPVIPHVQNPTELYGNSQREPDPSLLIISQLTPHVVTTDNNDCNAESLSAPSLLLCSCIWSFSWTVKSEPRRCLLWSDTCLSTSPHPSRSWQ